jgi:transcriptional regulator with XRE-family HTH domain
MEQNQVTTEERDIVTRRDVARRFSVSERTIANWQRGKLIPFIAIGARTIRFDLEDVRAALVRNHPPATRRPRHDDN